MRNYEVMSTNISGELADEIRGYARKRGDRVTGVIRDILEAWSRKRCEERALATGKMKSK
jgi:hypothetical protein